jgi:GTP pyrophosphokinase
MRHSYEHDESRLRELDSAIGYLSEGFRDKHRQRIADSATRVWPLRERSVGLPNPFTVAAQLKELGADAQCVVAALLGCHAAIDVIPLTDLEQVPPADATPIASHDDLGESYSGSQRRLIESVRWLNSFARDGAPFLIQGQDGADQAERVRRLVLVMIEDVRALLIKLAFRVQRLHLLLKNHSEFAVPIARETLDVYAPLANRLGVAQLKWQLEDLSFRLLDPDAYKRIAKSLEERREDRERYIGEFVDMLSGRLRDAGLKNYEVVGRPKHLYSIWRKMQRKRVEVTALYDVRAVRILVDDVQQCYTALGIVHSGWQHLPKEFDDYVANPKENGYQSLHTAVIGPGGKPLEIQIRSRAMDSDAELGVAAHWRYKEGSASDSRLQKSINSLRGLLETTSDNDEGLLEAFNTEVFSDRVYVFTPSGEVIDLPALATPLDFAYHVHTEIGHRCRGAKVNGRIVQLGQRLQNGDQVEILTGKISNPSRDWMNKSLGFLQTSRARGKVRAWFNVRDQETHHDDGKQIVEREIKRLNARELPVSALAEKLGYDTVEGVFVAVGRGEISHSKLVASINALQAPEFRIGSRAPRKIAKRQNPEDIQVRGVGSLLTQMAACCNPVPYDPIVGFITRGKGVSVHKKDCSNILNLRAHEQERLIEVDWGQEPSGDYQVNIELVAYDRQGLLRDITAVTSNEGVNVTAMNTRTAEVDLTAHMHFTLRVSSIEQLVGAMDKLRQLRNVISVQRVSDG